ncbi:hypothetical protein SKAU_G00083000 [Synaphobranchus kaupii]|uniref:Uncharacterized protein n=1 Tax=Synaphobranchus kaupii TaxID=118154 RepID=A0A9Q1FVH5_SYNKA|nr:hypothetical protein SKAU_G00083000 [Synaphobranchus kaupii]
MPPERIPKVALRWMKRGRPKSTWVRTVDAALKESGLSWDRVQAAVKDRLQWQKIVVALCDPPGTKRTKEPVMSGMTGTMLQYHFGGHKPDTQCLIQSVRSRALNTMDEIRSRHARQAKHARPPCSNTLARSMGPESLQAIY